MATNCECCEGLFERKGKGFKRVSLSSKFRGGPSAAETLTRNFNINVTPGKAAFICERNFNAFTACMTSLFLARVPRYYANDNMADFVTISVLHNINVFL